MDYGKPSLDPHPWNCYAAVEEHEDPIEFVLDLICEISCDFVFDFFYLIAPGVTINGVELQSSLFCMFQCLRNLFLFKDIVFLV